LREISSSNLVKGREQFILDKCRNKNVLHLGCCDEPYTKFVFDKNSSLFQRIEKVFESQLRPDIYREGIDYLHGLGQRVAFKYTALKQLLGYNGLRVTGIFLSDQLHIDGNVEGFEKKSAKDWILIPFRLIKAMIRRILVKLFPLFSECLIAVCKI